MPGRKPYCDPRRYDLEAASWTWDLRFYRRESLRLGSPVLELGCGTGRVALELARAGLEVTGVDSSRAMLRRARAKSRRGGLSVAWVMGDMRRLSLGRRFRAVLLPCNTIQHMTDERSVLSMLRGARRHLEPGGRFILDVYNPRARVPREVGKPRLIGRYRDRGRKVAVWVTHSYDRRYRVYRVLFRHVAGGRSVYLEECRMRPYFAGKLASLLRRAGLRIVRRWGDFDASPLRRSSPHQVLICRAARSIAG